MTREEAIEIIRNYDINGCGYCHQGGNEIEEAFEMAIKALEQESCGDCVSRQVVIDLTGKSDWFESSDDYNDFVNAICELPPVNPQRMGHWIDDTNGTYTDNHDTWECSQCGHAQILLEGTPKDNDYNYCPNCGAKMLKPQESEE